MITLQLVILNSNCIVYPEAIDMEDVRELKSPYHNWEEAFSDKTESKPPTASKPKS